MAQREQQAAVQIVVVGSSNVDLVIPVPHLPMPGETVLGGQLRQFMGGRGANQAVAARRLGAEVHFIGGVGDDVFGDTVIAALTAEGLRLEHCRRHAGIATGVAAITVDSQGENSIVVAPGANAHLTPQDITAATASIQTAAAVIAQLEVPPAAIHAAFTIARAAGTTTVLNPAPAQPLDDPLLALVDVMICNAGEAEQLLHVHVSDAAGALAAALAFVARGARVAVVTLGEQGAVLATTTTSLTIPAFAVSVRDTTAAGDAFVGSLTYALATAMPIAAALRFATAASALCVMRDGAQPALPRYQEVRDFLATRD